MTTFEIAADVFDRLDGLCIGYVVARGVDNARGSTRIEASLAQSVADCAAYFEGVRVRDHESIAPYREAFGSLSINPNRFMCSIEALLTRVSKGNGVPGINPAVDLGNSVSLRHLVPIGAHDISSLHGGLQVRFARPDDVFVPFGSLTEEAVDTGELVYATADSVRTRRWIWRQSELGKIVPRTTDIIFPIDGFAANRARVVQAQEDLARALREELNCHVETGWLDGSDPIGAV